MKDCQLIQYKELRFGILITQLILFCYLCVECKNKYERIAIGSYKIYSYSIADSNANLDLPSLILYRDKTFSLNFKSKRISGQWSAGDYGDFTSIEFSVNKKFFADAYLTGNNFEFIKILNPSDFNCSFLKKMIFKREAN